MGMLIGAILGYYIFRSIFGVFLGMFLGNLFLNARARRGYSSIFSTFNGSRIQEMQELYFYTFFTLLGKIAKADGTISKQEGDYVVDLINKLNLNTEYKSSAIHYFNNAKNETKSIDELAHEFHNLFHNAPQVERQLLYQLAGIASADGVISSEEESILQSVARIFSISMSELHHMMNSFQASTEQSYHILGVSKDASDIEIKKTYKRLVKEYHPDMLKSKGMSPSMIEQAKKRFLEIQNAWDSIRKERNIT